MGGLLFGGVRGIVCILPVAKLLFRCVQPQRATLIRVAFDRSNPSMQKHSTPNGVLCFWRSERDCLHFACGKIIVPLRPAAAGNAHPRCI